MSNTRSGLLNNSVIGRSISIYNALVCSSSLEQITLRAVDIAQQDKCFTQPLVADLCLPQHAALYSDMCDRVVDHMRPAVEKILAQALVERGRDAQEAGRMAGVGMYGVLMMARRGEMTMESAAQMLERLTGVAFEQQA